jgi:predicted GNAT family acetyltransferase
MSDEKPAFEVRHNTAASRFEATVAGLLCRADYRLIDGVMRMHHTEVPAELADRGIASELVRAAFAYAEANGHKVLPACSYVRVYMKRHPETRALLPDGFRV